MTLDMLKFEARLKAMEIMIAQAHIMIHVGLKVPSEIVALSNQHNLAALARNSMPGLAPEMSDHYTAELHDAVDHLQGMVRTLREAAAKR